MTRALVLQHERNERLGLIGEWAAYHCVELATAVTAREALPDPRQFDFLVVLGSHASVYDTAVPWIPLELAFLRRAIDDRVPVLGVCFGAQLLSKALGGEVHRAREREIGWYVVDSVDPELVPSGPWWEFHSDAFTIPPGGIQLACTAVCPQAFAHGPHLGVQFHPEITFDMHHAWVAERPHELVALGIDPERLLPESGDNTSNARSLVRTLLDGFVGRAADRRTEVA